MFNKDAVRMRGVMGRTHAAMHRAVFEDPRLSYEAVGIHAYIANQSHWVAGWEAHETDIVNRHTNGRYSVREAIKELIELGYVNRVQERIGGRLAGWRLDFYECPEVNPHYVVGADGNRDKPYVIDNLDKDDATLDADGLTHRENQILDQEADLIDVSNRDSKNTNPDPSLIQDQELKDQITRAPAQVPSGPSWADIERGRRGIPMRRQQQQAMQRVEAAKNAGIEDFRIVTEVTEAVTKVHGNTAAAQTSDSVLRQMQDLAISLASDPICIRSAKQVEALYQDWKAATGKVVPWDGVLLKYASRLIEEGRLKDGNITGEPAAKGSGSSKRSNGRAAKPGDTTGIDWTERARAAQEQYRPSMPAVPDGDITF